MKVWPGSPYPLGATWDGIGVNFALFSEHATGVDLCLFDSPYAGRESHRIPLRERTDQVWHSYLPEAKPGQLYGYRVHGPHDLRAGHRFNPAKLLFDPYGKAVGRNVRWHDSMFGFTIGSPDSRDDRDNAAYAPLAAVVESFRFAPDQLKTIGTRAQLVRLRDDYLPVLELQRVVELPPQDGLRDDAVMVVLEAEGQRFAVRVHELLGQQQVVVKSLEPNVGTVDNVAGATLMGDGRVALILDVVALARRARQ